MKDTIKLIQDMLAATESIEAYAIDSFETFLADDKTQDAIMFNLIILGEAANNIPLEFQEEHTEIPWASIIGTRNVIVYGYDHVKLHIVWDILQNNIQPLKARLLELLSR